MTDVRKTLRVSQLNAIRRHVIPAPQRMGPRTRTCTLAGPRIDRKPHGSMGRVVWIRLHVASGGQRHERSSPASTANASSTQQGEAARRRFISH